MKILVSGILLLCSVSLGDSISGLGELNSEQSNNSQNPSPSPVEHLEGLVKYFKVVEERNREQEKVIEELKQEMKSLKEKNAQELKTLKDKFYQLESKLSVDRGVWLMTPPLRGPPGKQGDSGPKGETGRHGETGAKGDQGDRGFVGPNGRAGEKGDRGNSGGNGVKGDSGQKGEKGSQGPTGQKGDRGEKGQKGDQPPIDPRSPKSCSDDQEFLPPPRSKKQTIHPHGNTNKFEVLCDFETDGGGWTLIQKRTSGPKQEFQKNWNEYSKGFGSLDGNFWLGLENIHALTKNGDQELRIELEDFEGEKRWAKYSSFSVSNAADFYRLTIGGFSGDATDSMAYINGMKFTTKDRDNDEWGGNCAVEYGGSWWYPSGCGSSNLNGPYRPKGASELGILWLSWKSIEPLAKSEMKVRKRK